MPTSLPPNRCRLALPVRTGLRSTACSLLGALAVVLLGSPAAALANSYKGLLHGGTLTVGSNARSESGGFVYASHSWTAPAGVQFTGFAYTSGSFSSTSDNSVGGVSAGFGGDGSASAPTILFPWTRDCSITSSGHHWTGSGGAAVAGSSGQPSCRSGGNPSGWNYANAEIESANPGADPQSDYHRLWLTVFCQAASCRDDPGTARGTASASVTDLSGDFIDSSDRPAGRARWDSVVRPSSWYQTNTGGLALTLSATDPAGVCAMYAGLTGASKITSGPVGRQDPAVDDVGGAIGKEFASGSDPCWTGQANTGTWTLPGGLANGTYRVSLFAANPGNYESQGFSSTNSPEVASHGDAIHLDDSTPSISWPDAPVGWTSQTSEQLQVSVGPSGLASVTCTDNGTDVPAVMTSGSASGAGTTVWTVATGVSGANSLSCHATNGDVNGALVGSVSQTFDVDAAVPTISFTDAGYAENSWSNQRQTVTVTATGGAKWDSHHGLLDRWRSDRADGGSVGRNDRG